MMGRRMQRNMWTAEEDEYLMVHYPTMHAREIAKHLHRSTNAVHGRAYMKGYRYKQYSDGDIRTFTEAEDAVILAHNGVNPYRWYKQLENRTLKTVYLRIKYLKIIGKL